MRGVPSEVNAEHNGNSETRGGPAATARRILDFLIAWILPFFPLLFIGLEVPGTGKTISAPKLALPALICLGAYALGRSALKPKESFSWLLAAYLAWLSAGVFLRAELWGYWHLA